MVTRSKKLRYENVQYLGESFECVIQGRFYNIRIKKINDKGYERYIAFIYFPNDFERCIVAKTFIPSEWRYDHKPEIFRV